MAEIETRSYDQLPEATALTPDDLLTMQGPDAGPLKKISVRKAFQLLQSCDIAVEAVADLTTNEDAIALPVQSLAVVYANPDATQSGYWVKTSAVGSGTWARTDIQYGIAASFADQAAAAAAAAAAFGNFKPGTLAEALAVTEEGDRFSISDEGVLEAYVRTAIGATLIARAVTPESLALPGAADGIGTGEGPLTTALVNRAQIFNVDAYGAVGDCVPGGVGATTGAIDTSAFNAAIDALWNNFSKYVGYDATTRPFDVSQFPVGGPVLTGSPGKLYRLNGDLRSPPPGTIIDFSECVLVMDEHNIDVMSLLRPDSGGVFLPEVGGGTSEGYGTSGVVFRGMNIHCNGYGGTFWRIDTADRIGFGPINIYGAGYSPNIISAALVEDSRFGGVTPADYAKVKIGDVYHLGQLDFWGNAIPVQVIDKQVENALAIDRTYGTLKFDQDYTDASGNVDCPQISVPHVTMKLQQSYWWGRSQYINCPWSFYHGRNRDEFTTGGDGWRNETVVGAFGFNDSELGEFFQEGLDYGCVFGPWSLDFTVKRAAMQFNRLGSHMIINAVNFRALEIRTEELSPSEDTVYADDRNVIPGVAIAPDCRATIVRHKFGFNGSGRQTMGFGSGSFCFINGFESINNEIPTMPNGSAAPYVRQDNLGQLTVHNGQTLSGPGEYLLEPRRWVSNPSGGATGSGYTGIQTSQAGQHVFQAAGTNTMFVGPDFTNGHVQEFGFMQADGSFEARIAIVANGWIKSSGGGGLVQILGAGRGGAITRPTADLESLRVALTALLDELSSGGHHPLFNAP